MAVHSVILQILIKYFLGARHCARCGDTMINKRDTKLACKGGYCLPRETDKSAKTIKCTDGNTWGKHQN